MTPPAPARVLFVITQLDRGGGAERQLYLLCSRLDKQRFLPAVVCLKHGGEWALRIRQAGVTVVELTRRHRFELSRLIGLWRAIRTFRPDLLVTMLFTANTYARLLSLAAGVPRRICCERGGDEKTPLRLWFERRLAAFTDAIVFNSRRNESAARAAGVRGRTLTIYNGVETPNVEHDVGWRILEDLGIPRNATLVGKVGRLHPRKGYDLFLALASILAARPDVHFLIIGDGPLRSWIEHQIEVRGLRGRVTLTGQLSDPLPPMACLRVMVMTSVREGMSNALMEAMALGVPCVVSAAGGSEELIADGVNGFVVPKRDPVAFARRVTELLDQPGLWERISATARERVARQFSVERMVRSYESLFDDILGNAHQPSLADDTAPGHRAVPRESPRF